MAHLGVFCLPMPSHINLFLTLANELRGRGHQVTFFNIPEVAPKVLANGCHFESIEPGGVPSGTLFRMISEMSDAGGFKALRIQGQFDELRYGGILEKAPPLVHAAGIEALIVDQGEPCSGSIAELLHLPWVSVANGLCFNAEPDIPPFITGWNFHGSMWARFRNRLAWAGMGIAAQRLRKLVNAYRESWALPSFGGIDDTFSPYAQISQQVAEFDFPRRLLPAHFHYVGPFRRVEHSDVAFPWQLLDGRPMIYASLGTLVNRHRRLLVRIAEACASLPYQVVLSLGGGGTVEEYSGLPGSPLVVKFAPQLELLAKAALAVTHAGLNTTLESLSHGVPLLAIPIAFEQPAIAARIAWTGVGCLLKPRRASVRNIRHAIECMMQSDEKRSNAKRIAERIARSGGVRQAATIIERVIETRSPVIADQTDSAGE